MKNDTEKSTKKNSTLMWYKLFFNKYTLYGLIFVLSAIIIFLCNNSECVIIKISLNILATLLQTIGIAFIVGSVFDFSKNSKEFTEFVANLLSDIVVSKEFLCKLTKEDKQNALSLILKPTNNQLEQYSNINEYFIKKIDESTKMFITNFKSHLCINVIARYNHEKTNVIIIGTIRYRIYKIQDKYEPLKLIFDDEGCEILNRRIIHTEGIYDINQDNSSVNSAGGLDYKEYLFEIPNDLLKHKYLTIESEIKEIGHDHWTSFNWTSLTPYDGLNFSLKCEDNLRIKKKTLFDKKDQYIFRESEDSKQLDICSTDWLDPYTGFSIVIAKDDSNTSL